ncbi:MAG: hypothetical protein NC131_09880 [Roseburia sp.]|nr:hypothetical protein [Roseburia sp.]
MEQIERRASVMALKELAYRATQGTSFDPDKRGEMLLNDCEKELRHYTAQLPVELHEHFEKRYLELYANWLSAYSRCISSFITGPARFPVRRAEKLNGWERSAREKLDNWATRFVQRANKQARLTGWEEIARLQDKVEKLTAWQELMKAANKIIRSSELAEVEKVDELVALGMSEKQAMMLLAEPQYAFLKRGFQPYQLTNNLAKIKDTQARLDRLTAIASTPDRTIELEGVTVELCNSEERIRLHFDGKPEPDMIAKLKRAAFRWSPRNMAWQRQLTNNALYETKRLLGVEQL